MSPPARSADTPDPTGSAVLSVVGLGDPVLDVLLHVSPEWLASIADHVGGCTPISHEELLRLTARAAEHCDPDRVPGGSAANVMKGLANLSGGEVACTFVGMVGADATAKDYETKLRQQGVRPLLLESAAGPTASCLCFVTPDGQRTMRTCLGAASALTSASQLPPGWLGGAALLHCEGYVLYKPCLAHEVLGAAKAAGARTSLDLASFELVRGCKAALLGLLRAGLVDVVFANEEEALALLDEAAGEADGADAAAAAADAGADTAARVAAAQAYVLQHAQVCVVSLGARGAVARARGGACGRAPAGGVRVVDTVGAGDCFSSGFLYAYLLGCPLQQCAAVGCLAGSEAVQTKGAVLSEAAWARLRASVAQTLGRSSISGCGGGGAQAAEAAAAAAAATPGSLLRAGADAAGCSSSSAKVAVEAA